MFCSHKNLTQLCRYNNSILYIFNLNFIPTEMNYDFTKNF